MTSRERDVLTEQWKEGGFFRAASAILRNPDLSKNAKVVYCVLCSYAGSKQTCFPSQERIAADIGGGIGMVKLALNELEKAGIITRMRRKQTGGSRVVYALCDGFHENI